MSNLPHYWVEQRWEGGNRGNATVEVLREELGAAKVQIMRLERRIQKLEAELQPSEAEPPLIWPCMPPYGR